MTEDNKIYKCQICGNIVEVLHASGVEIICCGQPMDMMEEKTEDEGNEKHVPVIEVVENKVKVKVGDVPHPMEEKHYISLIEVLKEGKVIASARLYPGQKPEAEFCLENTEGITARELCNLHGLWRSR